ncbi:hypothetical protein QBC46DRAFT_273420 [Diplogelasinospora grovesii]|uniref:F-box domain-containing protein n=1 Tax=Diplogelasinospora grovesii TaxID=303347 RepID=A0AAN6RZL4_9PEZI|nr:hypothetical protein QBC46DRAFT_273420 [Diplogelasinospora grovesii]
MGSPQSGERSASTTESPKCPLVAATLHNCQHSPIYRMTEEILMIIMKHLDADILTQHCLRRASRLFRRLILGSHYRPYSPNPGVDDMRYLWDLNDEYWTLRGFEPGHMDMLRSRLRNDQLCTACLQSSELNRTSENSLAWIGCKFSSWPRSQCRLHCAGCDRFHDGRAFSAAQAGKEKRICIGREGALRLCEHIQISWSDVESGLARCSTVVGAKPTAAEIRCDKAIHRACCQTKEARPTICLEKAPDGRCAFLTLTWTAHARLDVNEQGRFDSHQVRSMFQRHRRTGAHFLMLGSQPGSGPLMEMRCFGRADCTCLSYATGQEGSGPGSGQSNTKGYKDCLGRRPGWASWHQVTDFDLITESVGIRLCPRSSTSEKQCVATHYARRIQLDLARRIQIDWIPRCNPNHKWFHALDPDSYVLDDTTLENVWPSCKDASCRNYHRRTQTLRCPSRGQAL